MLSDVLFPDIVGGAGRVAYHLGLELSKKGHDVHILTRNTDGGLPSHQQLLPNLTAHRFFVPRKESLGLFFSEIKNSLILAGQMAKKTAFDIVCIHQSMVAIGPLLSGCFNNIPIIYYYHSPWHEEFLVKKRTGNNKSGGRGRVIARIMRLVEKRILRKASKVIVLSQYMANKLSEIHNIPADRVVKIPGGVDLNRFHLPDEGKEAAKLRLSLSQHKTIFLTVRNLVPRMGLENLIEAFSRSDILKENGLLLIGGQGFLENHLRSKVDDLNLKESIRLLGHIPDDDLPGTYQAADFFVLPTRELEGFGLVILEAMACGIRTCDT
ncbi:MAG: glycosyltransferase family 4 protein [Deltaproteobacteria bacterium]|nr:glycosyltransferase family 4 protein [Deltaproteobacteria bacterium]